jgi:hypothetical protein
MQSSANASINTTEKTSALSHIPADRGGTLNRTHSSDSAGSAGIFVSRLGKKRMPMSTGRSIPMPSLYFRKSSVPVHEPPTLLRRTGDESAQFSHDHHEEKQQQQQQQQQRQQPEQPQQQQRQQKQHQQHQHQQPKEHRKQPPQQQQPPQEDIMSAVPLQFPERPTASTWFCRFCSYANVDLDNSGCAVCGMESTIESTTTATTGTMATAKEVPYSRQDSSSPSPTALPTSPAMDTNAVRSVSPSSNDSTGKSAYYPAAATTHHPEPVETVPTVVPVNPFDETSLMPPPTTLNRYVTPTITTTPSHGGAQHQEQGGPPGSVSANGMSTVGNSNAGSISNLPTPRASNVSAPSEKESSSAAAAPGRSFWRRRWGGSGPSPDLGETIPVVPIRRKTPEPLSPLTQDSELQQQQQQQKRERILI